MSKTRAPFPYYGGASLVLKWHNDVIRDLREKYELTTWVDTFAGSGLYTLNQDPPFPVEVLNDKSDLITNAFKVLRDNSDELMERLKLTEYSQAVWDECRYIHPEDDEVMRAWKWIVVLSMAFSGVPYVKDTDDESIQIQTKHQWRYGVSSNNKSGALTISGFRSRISCLPEIIERLQRVQITNWDFGRVIEKFDTPKTIFLMDPPFVADTRVGGAKVYENEMGNDEHTRLLDMLKEVSGAFVLRGYSNDLYEQVANEHGWSREERERKCSASHIAKTRKAKGGTEQPSRTEVIWFRGPKTKE